MSAKDWLNHGLQGPCDIAVVGIPICRASISPSQARTTPNAFRAALKRFSAWDSDHGIDLHDLAICDYGDIVGDSGDSDASVAHLRAEMIALLASYQTSLTIFIGGDNSLTAPAMRGIAATHLDDGWGLITFDAHHDVRSLEYGLNNGNVVRSLVENGLPGQRIAQIGIHSFANSYQDARWAIDNGIHMWSADDVRRRSVIAILDEARRALESAGAHRFYVDFDFDVLDRAFAPACPGSMPGGLTPDALQQAAFVLGSDARVVAADMTEVDARQDVNDVTVRCMGSAFLAACSGVSTRRRSTNLAGEINSVPYAFSQTR